MTSCVLCSFSPAVACPQSQTGVCTPCLMLEELDAKIAETRTILASLFHKRNSLKPDINRAHDPFHRLPPELTSHIFMLSPDSDKNHQPFLLGAVNQRWRAIAWSTPQLWTYIRINLTPSNIQCQNTMIDAYLARSGSLPLSIHVEPQPERSLTPEEKGRSHLFDPVWRAIGAHSERWESLNMAIPLCIIPRLRGISQSSSKLQCLEIRIIDLRRSKSRAVLDMWQVPPSPVSVKVSQVTLESVGINWDNAVEVDVDDFTEDECLELFRRASRMRTCAISFGDSDVDHTVSETLLVHQCLQKLKISMDNFDGEPTLFHQLAFPSLEGLHFRFCSFDNACLQSLFTRPSRNLSHLVVDLADFNHFNMDIVSVLRLSPSLEILELRNFRPVDPDQIISLLAETSAIPEDTDLGLAFLPHLTSLIFNGEERHHWPSIPALFPPKQVVPKTRYRPFKKLELRLYFMESCTDEDYIDQHSLPPLLELIERGFELSILNDKNNEDFIRISQLHHQDAEKESEMKSIEE